jgi:hypothetical protein
MAADVRIDIAAQFVGKKAFKEAETSTDRLTKNVKGLAKGLLAVYSAQKILSYAKASVKAFAEDDKAATALGTTLKNLGLAYGSNIGTVNGYISRLEMQTGVLDDELRPAMDRLLRATGDVTKSQELLSLALDISAGTGKSVTQVSQSLQKAYLGQTQALGRLGVGLSKAELTTSSFEEIQARLATLFAGQATAAADTYAGSLAKLTIAGNNAKETIGKGLVDALKAATGSSTVDPVVQGIDAIANAIANLARETGDFIAITRENFNLKDLSFFYKDPKAFKGLGNISMTVSGQVDNAVLKTQTKVTKLTKEQAAAQAKILKHKRLGAAIDKANLALNKGNEVFDMDKIQIAAALTNQAEQLGKATSSAQVLQIANDTARLNVKRSILALEDAIAAKDEAAIIAATAKLNADLKVLGTLGMQNVKLQDIKSILESLKPKDLINISNLENALRLLREINLASTGSTKIPTSASLGSGIPAGDYIAPISTVGGSIEAILEYADAAAARANAFADLLDMENASAASSMASSIDLESIARSSLLQGLSGGAGVAGAVSGSRYAAQAANAYNITINTGVGDPNAIAEAIDNVLREAQQRGTLVGGVFAV